MTNLDALSDINIFFSYGSLDTELEIEHNLISALLQKERSFYYNRSDSVGIDSYENHPNNLLLQIYLRFQIASWANLYNGYTGDGTNGSKERRIAVSQFSILFEQENDSLDIDVQYLTFSDYAQIKSLKTSVGI